MIIVIVGLVILVLAAVVAIAGVFSNTGSAHALTNAFTVFGHHMTGSTGTLFLYGIVVGAVAMLGLGLLLTGARRTSRRGHVARHGLLRSRRESAAAVRERDELAGQHDELVQQRDTARAQNVATAKERDDLLGQRDRARAHNAATGQEHEDLTGQRQGARAQAASGPASEAAPRRDGDPDPGEGHHRHLWHRRPVHH